MAYFSPKQDRLERSCKVAADVACAAMFVVFSIVFFGWRDGLIGFAVLEATLLSLDWFMPGESDPSGAVR